MEELNRDILPDNCPIKLSPQIIQSTVERYALDEVKRVYIPATITEKNGWEKG